MEALIIDGYNLLFAWEELASLAERDMDRARRRLISQLATYATAKKVSLTLVFDSKAQLCQETSPTSGRIKVVYSSPPETADDLIVRLVEKALPPGALTVVSSDHQVATRARQRGAKAISCSEFLRRLEKFRVPSTSSGQAEELSAAELEEWLKIFTRDQK